MLPPASAFQGFYPSAHGLRHARNGFRRERLYLKFFNSSATRFHALLEASISNTLLALDDVFSFDSGVQEFVRFRRSNLSVRAFS